MGEVREYRSHKVVRAEVIEDDSKPVVTRHGIVYPRKGDYLVYDDDGQTRYAEKGPFEDEYLRESDEDKGKREFVPQGHTVEEVLEFLEKHPEETDRIKRLEKNGASRKGILEA